MNEQETKSLLTDDERRAVIKQMHKQLGTLAALLIDAYMFIANSRGDEADEDAAKDLLKRIKEALPRIDEVVK